MKMKYDFFECLLKIVTVLYCALCVVCIVGVIIQSSNKKQQQPHKGQHFDLRGGSTVIEVNPAEKVVWFRCDKDSAYFYEPFSNIGIQ